jgi:hypothetical protein
MMYFTETGEVPEDPIALNEEFEKEYDTNEYEAKVSKLLSHAYHRLRKENSSSLKEWQAAIETLQEGDHYLLVLESHALPRISLGSLSRLTARLALLVLAVYGLWFAFRYFMAVTGVSAGIIFGALFAVTLLAVALKPEAVSNLAQQGVTWLLVFLIKRKDTSG